MKNLFKHSKYFGKPLADIQRRKTGQCDRRIPSLVYVCVMYLLVFSKRKYRQRLMRKKLMKCLLLKS